MLRTNRQAQPKGYVFTQKLRRNLCSYSQREAENLLKMEKSGMLEIQLPNLRAIVNKLRSNTIHLFCQGLKFLFIDIKACQGEYFVQFNI